MLLLNEKYSLSELTHSFDMITESKSLGRISDVEFGYLIKSNNTFSIVVDLWYYSPHENQTIHKSYELDTPSYDFISSTYGFYDINILPQIPRRILNLNRGNLSYTLGKLQREYGSSLRNYRTLDVMLDVVTRSCQNDVELV